MGGNVFKGKTDRIKRDDITTTLDNYFDELGRLFPKKKDIFKYFKPVGSVGKKDTSGDIDLAIDVSTILDKNFSDESIKEWGIEPQIIKDNFIKLKARSRTATDSQLMLKAFLLELVKVINSKSPNIFCDEKKVTPGNIFSLYPQFDGTTKKKLDIGVQIDWMIGDLDWLEFSYYSEEYKGNVKGLHRTQLMLSMFTNKGLIFNHAGGVKDKETNTILATKPTEAIDKLNELYKFKLTKSILENYFTLRTFLEKNLDKSEYNSIIGIYLRILDSTRCDIPEDLQNTWKARKTELQLTGKYLPEESKLLRERKMYTSFKDLIYEDDNEELTTTNLKSINYNNTLYKDKGINQYRAFWNNMVLDSIDGTMMDNLRKAPQGNENWLDWNTDIVSFNYNQKDDIFLLILRVSIKTKYNYMFTHSAGTFKIDGDNHTILDYTDNVDEGNTVYNKHNYIKLAKKIDFDLNKSIEIKLKK